MCYSNFKSLFCILIDFGMFLSFSVIVKLHYSNHQCHDGWSWLFLCGHEVWGYLCGVFDIESFDTDMRWILWFSPLEYPALTLRPPYLLAWVSPGFVYQFKSNLRDLMWALVNNWCDVGLLKHISRPKHLCGHSRRTADSECDLIWTGESVMSM